MAAKKIAAFCNLDVDKAYSLALLHDIGRYEGVRGLHHIVAGYQLMMDKDYPVAARVCLTHSFPLPILAAFGGNEIDCTKEEIQLIEKVLATEFDIYDKLIQLCDALGSHDGICTIERRLIDVARRQGFNDYTLKKWEAFYDLKNEFDTICGTDIYRILSDEIMKSLY